MHFSGLISLLLLVLIGLVVAGLIDPQSKCVLNDNFCDCSDGSDETATSACAGLSRRSGQNKVLFTCSTKNGLLSTVIPTSRVHDGIVDKYIPT